MDLSTSRMKLRNYYLPLILMQLLRVATFAQSDSVCSFIIVDVDSKHILNDAIVYIREKELKVDSESKFHIDCTYHDSIMVSLSGYETTLLLYENKIDTIFLTANSYELEPIEVWATQGKKSYKLGKRNNSFDLGCGLVVNGCRLQSFIANSLQKRLLIEEGFIYITKKTGENTNLLLSFYKNNNGKMGKLVAEHIPIENLNKQKGWFRLLFDEKISIPAEGFFIEIKQQTISSEPTYIGMIEINNATVDSYWIQPGLNQQITLLDANKHYGVKIHFIVR